MADPARTAALEVLRAVRAADAYTNLALPAALKKHGLSGRDAAFATELTSGTVRRQGLYDAVLAACVDRPLAKVQARVLDALRLGTHQLLAMRVPAHAAISTTVALVRSDVGPGAAGFANAVLRRVSEHDERGLGRAGRAGACRRPGRVPERRARPPAVGGGGARRGRRGGRDRGVAGRRQRGARRDPGGPSRAVDPRGAAGRAHALVAVRRAPGLRRPGCRRGRGRGPGGRAGRGLAAGRARPGRRRRSTGPTSAGSTSVPDPAARPRCWRRWRPGVGPGCWRTSGCRTARTWSGARSVVPTACWAWSPATAPARRGPPARSTGCSSTRRAPASAPSAGVPRRAGAGSPPTSTRSYPLQQALLSAALDSVRPGGVVLYATCSPVLAETSEVVSAVLAAGPTRRWRMRRRCCPTYRTAPVRCPAPSSSGRTATARTRCSGRCCAAVRRVHPESAIDPGAPAVTPGTVSWRLATNRARLTAARDRDHAASVRVSRR